MVTQHFEDPSFIRVLAFIPLNRPVHHDIIAFHPKTLFFIHWFNHICNVFGKGIHPSNAGPRDARSFLLLCLTMSEL